MKIIESIYWDILGNKLPISPTMLGPEIGLGVDYFISNKVCPFILFSYSFQTGVYNNFNYLRLKVGVKF